MTDQEQTGSQNETRNPRKERGPTDGYGGKQATRTAGSSRSQATDAWSREARRVREQARRRGLVLSEEDLALHDVRDLQALADSLTPAEPGGGWRTATLWALPTREALARPPWWGRHGPRDGTRPAA
jgi:hypothetical protein